MEWTFLLRGKKETNFGGGLRPRPKLPKPQASPDFFFFFFNEQEGGRGHCTHTYIRALHIYIHHIFTRNILSG